MQRSQGVKISESFMFILILRTVLPGDERYQAVTSSLSTLGARCADDQVPIFYLGCDAAHFEEVFNKLDCLFLLLRSRDVVFAEVVFAEVVFAEVVFAEVVFAEVVFAEVVFAEVVFAEVVFAEVVFAEVIVFL